MIATRTIKGFVVLVPSEAVSRTMMVGSRGSLHGSELALFKTLIEVRASAKARTAASGVARIRITMAESEQDLIRLHHSRRLIVIGSCRDLVGEKPMLYDFYGAVPPGSAANTTYLASYLGTCGWHTFSTFAWAEETAREVHRQTWSSAAIARFSIRLL